MRFPAGSFPKIRTLWWKSVPRYNRVYLGREEHYHYQDGLTSYYDNGDGSLCFVTDRADMYYFLYGEGWAHSQAEMLERGLTSDQYAEFARLQNGVLRQFEAQREILFAGQPFQPPESYLRNAELYEEGQTGNYNMLDGRLNNEPPVKPDLTDGQTYEEIQELAPETLPEEKSSILDRLKQTALSMKRGRWYRPSRKRGFGNGGKI